MKAKGEGEMEIARQVRVVGRVTGVGFRWSALREATKYPALKGYVRNVGDDEVELWLQGPRADVDAMTAWSRRGPFSARVDACYEQDTPPRGDLRDFNVR